MRKAVNTKFLCLMVYLDEGIEPKTSDYEVDVIDQHLPVILNIEFDVLKPPLRL